MSLKLDKLWLSPVRSNLYSTTYCFNAPRHTETYTIFEGLPLDSQNVLKFLTRMAVAEVKSWKSRCRERGITP